ncbi:hypothetical protein GQ457_16G013630 [Hibiscus cannabinus]
MILIINLEFMLTEIIQLWVVRIGLLRTFCPNRTGDDMFKCLDHWREVPGVLLSAISTQFWLARISYEKDISMLLTLFFSFLSPFLSEEIPRLPLSPALKLGLLGEATQTSSPRQATTEFVFELTLTISVTDGAGLVKISKKLKKFWKHASFTSTGAGCGPERSYDLKPKNML